jgi:hypothetical protein
LTSENKPVSAARKPPRPAFSYRGARRNALKAGAILQPHRWQTRPDHKDRTFKGPIRANKRKRA